MELVALMSLILGTTGFKNLPLKKQTKTLVDVLNLSHVHRCIAHNETILMHLSESSEEQHNFSTNDDVPCKVQGGLKHHPWTFSSNMLKFRDAINRLFGFLLDLLKSPGTKILFKDPCQFQIGEITV